MNMDLNEASLEKTIKKFKKQLKAGTIENWVGHFAVGADAHIASIVLCGDGVVRLMISKAAIDDGSIIIRTHKKSKTPAKSMLNRLQHALSQRKIR